MKRELTPDLARMQTTLELLSDSEVGGTAGGGVSRPALSAEDGKVRQRFAELCCGLNLDISFDDIGNMYASRPGMDRAALPVVVGSHLDTVPDGGRFDGILGVVVALETIALLNEAKLETLRPIIVVNWTGEEGARFSPAMIGSGVVSGKWDIDFAHSRLDAQGMMLRDELQRIGYLGPGTNRLKEFFASLELHIEQGTQLEDTGTDIGIVPGIMPVRWLSVTATGAGGHAGGPGPRKRQDPVAAVSRMILSMRDASVISNDFRSTVGSIATYPGSNNVIPSEVNFSVDLRSTDDQRLEDLLDQIKRKFHEIAGQEGVRIEIKELWSMPQAKFDASLVGLLERLSQEQAANWLSTTGAIGHDSVHLAGLGPTAMIFTPTRDGRSHCTDEYSDWRSIIPAAKLFANAVATLANSRRLDDITPELQSQAFGGL